ncbi:MAG: sigma-70 family RNA polymerase sigma factor [Planctomycetaceae bacterium]|nr:sigma-70 family RNA polymerase sigma factor [Planctomycetaceae bacterium]
MCNVSQPDPQQLLRDARAAPDAVLGPLLQLYGNYLRLLASAQLNAKLRARVSPSDVVQETFLEAHRDFAQFRGESEREFLAWLRKILANNLARLVERHIMTEKRAVHREVSLERMGAAIEQSTANLGAVLADEATSPSASASRREYTVILADQLAQMRPEYREVIVLRHLEGLPFKEIAERTHRTSGAARMLWLRAVNQLRQQLDALGVN